MTDETEVKKKEEKKKKEQERRHLPRPESFPQPWEAGGNKSHDVRRD